MDANADLKKAEGLTVTAQHTGQQSVFNGSDCARYTLYNIDQDAQGQPPRRDAYRDFLAKHMPKD